MLYPFAQADGNVRTSRVDLWAWRFGGEAEREAERASHPDVASAMALECVLSPGDVAYIPPGWWHSVESLSGSISVLLPFDMSLKEQRAMDRPWTRPEWGAKEALSSDANEALPLLPRVGKGMGNPEASVAGPVASSVVEGHAEGSGEDGARLDGTGLSWLGPPPSLPLASTASSEAMEGEAAPMETAAATAAAMEAREAATAPRQVISDSSFPERFARRAAHMPGVEHACMLDGRTDVDVVSLVESLGLTLPLENELNVLSRSRVIDAPGCAALREAVDASARYGTMSYGSDGVDRLPEHQLDLSRLDLEALVGKRILAELWKLPRRLLAQHHSGLPADEDDEDDVVGGPSWSDPEPKYEVFIFARRYSRETRPWIGFHYDSCAVTVNVALSDDDDHQGGRLLALLRGGMHVLSRQAGDATVHPSSVLHAVSAMEQGVRYSLILFFYNPR